MKVWTVEIWDNYEGMISFEICKTEECADRIKNKTKISCDQLIRIQEVKVQE